LRFPGARQLKEVPIISESTTTVCIPAPRVTWGNFGIDQVRVNGIDYGTGKDLHIEITIEDIAVLDSVFLEPKVKVTIISRKIQARDMITKWYLNRMLEK